MIIHHFTSPLQSSTWGLPGLVPEGRAAKNTFKLRLLSAAWILCAWHEIFEPSPTSETVLFFLENSELERGNYDEISTLKPSHSCFGVTMFLCFSCKTLFLVPCKCRSPTCKIPTKAHLCNEIFIGLT